MPSGPGAESSLISEIASLISSVDRTSSLSSVVIGGSANSGIDLSGQFGSKVNILCGKFSRVRCSCLVLACRKVQLIDETPFPNLVFSMLPQTQSC